MKRRRTPFYRDGQRVRSRGAAALQRHMIDADATLSEVAHQCGCAASTIADLLHDRREPGLAIAVRLSHVAGVPVEWWLEAETAFRSIENESPDTGDTTDAAEPAA